MTLPGWLVRLARSRLWIAIIVIAVGVLHGAWILKHGVRWGEDIERFSQWGDTLVALRFNWIEYLRRVDFLATPILYLSWVSVVAVAKVLAGSRWPELILILNWLAVMSIAALILTTVRRLTPSAVAVTVAGLFLANFEMLMFASFPLSDLLFLLLVTVIVVLSVRVAEHPTPRAIAGGTAVLLVACTFRPAAPPLIVVWAVALLWSRLTPLGRRWVVPALAVLIILGTFVTAAVMDDVARWPFEPLRGWLDYLKRDYDEGTIIVGRPETWVTPPSDYGDYLSMIYRRWIYFFAISLGAYSTTHKIVNVAFFIPAYSLALIALLRRSGPAHSAAITILFTAVLAISAFHAMQEVDFDHRYRLPAIPALVLLAALGSTEVVRRLHPRMKA